MSTNLPFYSLHRFKIYLFLFLLPTPFLYCSTTQGNFCAGKLFQTFAEASVSLAIARTRACGAPPRPGVSRERDAGHPSAPWSRVLACTETAERVPRRQQLPVDPARLTQVSSTARAYRETPASAQRTRIDKQPMCPLAGGERRRKRHRDWRVAAPRRRGGVTQLEEDWREHGRRVAEIVLLCRRGR
ncbi:hypothetical protein TRVL_04008 [Trypanosoma vivax]|nr:hypothetical protein TRVL_04008 [Trypanosoma vivax]